MDWMCGWSSTAPALQVQGPEFKSGSHQKKKLPYNELILEGTGITKSVHNSNNYRNQGECISSLKSRKQMDDKWAHSDRKKSLEFETKFGKVTSRWCFIVRPYKIKDGLKILTDFQRGDWKHISVKNR
jgi:hypothetical protein